MANLLELDLNLFTQNGFFEDKVGLPYSKELECAIMVVANACAKEKNRIKNSLREEFLIEKYHELRKYDGQSSEIRRILNEIADYDKKHG